MESLDAQYRGPLVIEGNVRTYVHNNNNNSNTDSNNYTHHSSTSTPKQRMYHFMLSTPSASSPAQRA